MLKQRVAVAMSGGVDSSVAAALLRDQGYQVEGVFMKNWSLDTAQSLTDCPWERDQADAAAVCDRLGIPFRSINFEKEYRERVVDYFLQEYQAGRTPNPDVMCNKEIKFKVLLDEVMKWGVDWLATGHYAQILEEEKGTGEGMVRYLGRGIDSSKDQSYFLWTLSDAQLAKVLFPLGGYTKKRVRALAVQYGLATAEKKDSQGICFIGHIDMKKYLQEHIKPREGNTYLVHRYIESEGIEERLVQAVEVGKHQGTMYYTIGERAGAIVDNGAYRRQRANQDVPVVYVIAKDERANRIYITDDRNDPDLYTQIVRVEGWQWSAGYQSYPGLDHLTCQVRYQQKEKVHLSHIARGEKEGQLEITTQEPLWAVAAGQSLVLYADDQRVVGGGIISV